MKRNTIFGFFLIMFSMQSSIYTIQIDTIEGTATSMASFAGKKIVISAFNASTPDAAWLQHLDSLQTGNDSLQVIAVPANDFSNAGNDATLSVLKDSLALHIVMLKATDVKKSAGGNQNLLLKWLTDVNENGHFDADVLAEGQMFIVNSNGILYSVLDKDVPDNILSQILNQNVSQ